MMTLTDMLLILFSCVAANHLGLVAAIEKAISRRLPVINCPKCLSFWATLIYGLLTSIFGCSVCCDSVAALPSAIPSVLALSFLAAYAAIWLELIMFSIDTLYNSIYDKINKDNQEAADPD